MSNAATPSAPSRYAIIRFHKYKSGTAIQKVKDHNLRTESKLPDGVDPDRTHLNLIEGAQTNEEFDEAMAARMATLTRKPRPDANRLCQAVVTGSPAVFDGMTREQSIELLRHGVDMVKARVGSENVLRVSFHFDEETPHAHIDFVPVVTRERKTKHIQDTVTTLDAQRILGGPVELEQWWTDYAELLKSKGYNVERATTAEERMQKGIKRPKHKTTRQWWSARVQEAETVMAAACEKYAQADAKKQAADLEHSRGNAVLIASAWAMKDKAAQAARDALKDERARLDAEAARVEKVRQDNVILATEIAVKAHELAEKIQEIEFITGGVVESFDYGAALENAIREDERRQGWTSSSGLGY